MCAFFSNTLWTWNYYNKPPHTVALSQSRKNQPVCFLCDASGHFIHSFKFPRLGDLWPFDLGSESSQSQGNNYAQQWSLYRTPPAVLTLSAHMLPEFPGWFVHQTEVCKLSPEHSRDVWITKATESLVVLARIGKFKNRENCLCLKRRCWSLKIITIMGSAVR